MILHLLDYSWLYLQCFCGISLTPQPSSRTSSRDPKRSRSKSSGIRTHDLVDGTHAENGEQRRANESHWQFQTLDCFSAIFGLDTDPPNDPPTNQSIGSCSTEHPTQIGVFWSRGLAQTRFSTTRQKPEKPATWLNSTSEPLIRASPKALPRSRFFSFNGFSMPPVPGLHMKDVIFMGCTYGVVRNPAIMGLCCEPPEHEHVEKDL